MRCGKKDIKIAVLQNVRSLLSILSHVGRNNYVRNAIVFPFLFIIHIKLLMAQYSCALVCNGFWQKSAQNSVSSLKNMVRETVIILHELGQEFFLAA